ncbi:hypothetical protein ACB094_04G017400 [Castanea mollissima]
MWSGILCWHRHQLCTLLITVFSARQNPNIFQQEQEKKLNFFKKKPLRKQHVGFTG